MNVRLLAFGCCILATASAAKAADTMANPVSALCVKNGATIEMKTLPNGAQRGVCVFPDGSRIDEWAYFRNKHRTPH